MKVVFLSNYFNHHQKPLSEALNKRVDYRFIETEDISEERIKLGWGEKEVPDYVVKYNPSLDLSIDDADVVIIGSAPQKLIANRIRQKKLTFEYSERIHKTGLTFPKWVHQVIGRMLHWKRYRNTYMLCASAYTAADYSKLFAYIGKTYKWGYFPQVKRYDNIDCLIELKHPASILWVARLIELKHPEVPLQVAKRLKEDGYSFTMSLIGNGKLEEKLKQQIRESDLEGCVHLLGSMKPEQVRGYMEQSEIFLFTSDFNEGWGAVLNEAMNSACAVVASHAIGSVPFLLKDGENGLVYKNGNTEDCYEKVKYLLEHSEERKQFGRAAYRTLHDEWNAEVAAERLLLLTDDLQKLRYSKRFSEGPCSKAVNIKDWWYEAK